MTVQRFLTWPLMVRFHYGHPDVWDKTWATCAAASPRRAARSRLGGHLRRLQRHPARRHDRLRSSSTAARGATCPSSPPGPETKISAGGAITTVSRDFLRMMLLRHLLPPPLPRRRPLLRDDAHVDVVGLPLHPHERPPRADEDGGYEQFEYADDTDSDRNLTARGRRRSSSRRVREGYGRPSTASCDAPKPAESFLEVDWRSVFSFVTAASDASVANGATAADGSTTTRPAASATSRSRRATRWRRTTRRSSSTSAC